MKKYKLDKLFDTNTDYRTRIRSAYVIKKISTDDTAEVTVKIDKKDLTVIIDKVAPLHTINSNLNKPLDLKQLFLVVPPDTAFRFEGTAAKLVKAIGDLVRLDVGEGLPADLVSRFKAQHNHYMTTQVETTVTASGILADGGEDELGSFSPTTAEKYLLRHILGVEEAVAGDPAEAEGDVALMFYLDGNPLDIEESGEGYLGISRYSAPLPPAETTENLPFSMENSPIEVLGDHTLSIKARNVSGGALFGTTAAQYTLYTVVDYTKFVA